MKQLFFISIFFCMAGFVVTSDRGGGGDDGEKKRDGSFFKRWGYDVTEDWGGMVAMVETEDGAGDVVPKADPEIQQEICRILCGVLSSREPSWQDAYAGAEFLVKNLQLFKRRDEATKKGSNTVMRELFDAQFRAAFKNLKQEYKAALRQLNKDCSKQKREFRAECEKRYKLAVIRCAQAQQEADLLHAENLRLLEKNGRLIIKTSMTLWHQERRLREQYHRSIKQEQDFQSEYREALEMSIRMKNKIIEDLEKKIAFKGLRLQLQAQILQDRLHVKQSQIDDMTFMGAVSSARDAEENRRLRGLLGERDAELARVNREHAQEIVQLKEQHAERIKREEKSKMDQISCIQRAYNMVGANSIKRHRLEVAELKEKIRILEEQLAAQLKKVE